MLSLPTLQPATRKWLRGVASAAGILLLIWYFAHNAAELLPAWHSLRQLDWQYVVLLIALECGYYLFHATASLFAYDAVNVHYRWRQLFLIDLEVIYLNTIIPSVGLAGSAPLLEYATVTRQSKFLTLVGYVIKTVMEVIGAAILLLALLSYAHYGLVLTVSAIAALCVVANLGTHVRAGKGKRMKPKSLLISLVFATFGNACEAILLVGLFRALGYSTGIHAILLVYAWSILTWYISPTPQGIGAVEVVAGGIIATLALPAGAVVIIPLLNRAFIHWLPVVAGAISFAARRPIRSLDEATRR